MAKRQFEIIISGGGPIGLATAIAAKVTLGSRARVLVCDPILNRQGNSIRTYAISAAPRRLLENLGVWGKLTAVQPIRKMEITDSALRDAVRQTFLEFEADGEAELPLADMVFHDDLLNALENAAHEHGVEFLAGHVTNFAATSASISVETSDGKIWVAGLLAACDGAASQVRELARIPISGWDYERDAIVATIGAEHGHGAVAMQHFLPAGTFALLPLTENRFSIVWVEKPEDATQICALPAKAFNSQLQARAGNAFGKLQVLDGPQKFPLRVQIARRFSGQRLVLAGDAAHTMHPLAGQGLNLGLRDTAWLMESLTQQAHLGFDIGAQEGLQAYERARRFETVKMLAATDVLFRLFTANAMPARALRDFGLGVVNTMPGFKTSLIREASGISGGVPALLRGAKAFSSEVVTGSRQENASNRNPPPPLI